MTEEDLNYQGVLMAASAAPGLRGQQVPWTQYGFAGPPQTADGARHFARIRKLSPDGHTLFPTGDLCCGVPIAPVEFHHAVLKSRARHAGAACIGPGIQYHVCRRAPALHS